MNYPCWHIKNVSYMSYSHSDYSSITVQIDGLAQDCIYSIANWIQSSRTLSHRNDHDASSFKITLFRQNYPCSPCLHWIGGLRNLVNEWQCQNTWWRHQMETFSALLAICAGKSPVPGDFPTLRPVSRSFDVFFDLHPNKRLSKQWWDWWFETPSCPLWRHRIEWAYEWQWYNSRWTFCKYDLMKWIPI